MPSQVSLYRLLLISPGDVEAHRDAVRSAIEKWNAHVGRFQGIRVEVVGWETHVTPGFGEEPQAVINEQVVHDCDIAIALFWTRLGTRTQHHESGSAEEIHHLRKAGKPVLVYFKSAAIPQDQLQDDQYQRLRDFRATLSTSALVGEFSDSEDLREKVMTQITRPIVELHELGVMLPAMSDPVEPAIAVSVSAAALVDEDIVRDFVRIEVENHSSVPVPISMIYCIIDRTAGRYIRTSFDGAFPFDVRNVPFVLSPADAHHYHLDLRDLPATLGEDAVAAVVDRLNRVYESAPGDLARAVGEARSAAAQRLRSHLEAWSGNPDTLTNTILRANGVGLVDVVWDTLRRTVRSMPAHLSFLFCDGLAKLADQHRDSPRWRAELVELAACALAKLDDASALGWVVAEYRQMVLRVWLIFDRMRDASPERCSTWLDGCFGRFSTDPATLIEKPDLAYLIATWAQRDQSGPRQWFARVLSEGRSGDICTVLSAFFHRDSGGRPSFDLDGVLALTTIESLVAGFDQVSRRDKRLADQILPVRDAFYGALGALEGGKPAPPRVR